MRYYAVIDTNVLVSAMLKWDSIPGNIMQFAFNNIICPLFNDEILNEYKAVLSRDKFQLSENDVNVVIEEITKAGINISENPIDEILPDPKDRVFYEVVMTARDSEDAYLVTGNIKHFPTKPFIVTPREMMELIMKESEN